MTPAAPGELRLWLPGYVTPTLNTFIRWHWRKQRAATRPAAWAVRLALCAARIPTPVETLDRAHVAVLRIARGAPPDPDGLVGGCKPLLDALQPLTERRSYGLGIIRDDSPDCITFAATARRAAMGEEVGTLLVITPVQG